MEYKVQKIKRFYKRWWFWVLTVFVLLLIIGVSGGSSPEKTTESMEGTVQPLSQGTSQEAISKLTDGTPKAKLEETASQSDNETTQASDQNNTTEVTRCVAQKINSLNNVQLLFFWDYLTRNVSSLDDELEIIAKMSQKLGCPKLVIVTPGTPEDLEKNWKTIKSFSGKGSQELETVNISDPKWRFKIVWDGTPEGTSSELWGIWQYLDDDPRYPSSALWVPAFYGPRSDKRIFPQFEENESRTGNFKLRIEADARTQWQIEVQIFSPAN